MSVQSLNFDLGKSLGVKPNPLILLSSIIWCVFVAKKKKPCWTSPYVILNLLEINSNVRYNHVVIFEFCAFIKFEFV